MSATLIVVTAEREQADRYADWLTPPYDVRTACGHQDLLQQLDETVDIIVIDQASSDLADDLLQQIHAHTLDCRTLLLTSGAPESASFDDSLQAPVTKTSLHDRVATLVRRLRYQQYVREYASTQSKRASLQTELDHIEVTDSPEFDRLQTKIDHVEAKAGSLLADFENEDFIAAFQELG